MVSPASPFIFSRPNGRILQPSPPWRLQYVLVLIVSSFIKKIISRGFLESYRGPLVPIRLARSFVSFPLLSFACPTAAAAPFRRSSANAHTASPTHRRRPPTSLKMKEGAPSSLCRPLRLGARTPRRGPERVLV